MSDWQAYSGWWFEPFLKYVPSAGQAFSQKVGFEKGMKAPPKSAVSIFGMRFHAIWLWAKGRNPYRTLVNTQLKTWKTLRKTWKTLRKPLLKAPFPPLNVYIPAAAWRTFSFRGTDQDIDMTADGPKHRGRRPDDENMEKPALRGKLGV